MVMDWTGNKGQPSWEVGVSSMIDGQRCGTARRCGVSRYFFFVFTVTLIPHSRAAKYLGKSGTIKFKVCFFFY